MIGDDHCGPFVAVSYVEPTDEQMPVVRGCPRERQLANLAAGHHQHGP